MSAAINQLIAKKSVATNPGNPSIELVPNYNYVRFFVYGHQGEIQLKQYDTNLVLFKHPLDYKPLPKPILYQDTALSDSVTVYFATVPINYNFGNTSYEVLQELFLIEPLDDSLENESSTLSKQAYAQSNLHEILSDYGINPFQVEAASFLLTGNIQYYKESGHLLRKLIRLPLMKSSLGAYLDRHGNQKGHSTTMTM